MTTLTTARQTATNVRNLTPITTVSRNQFGAVIVDLTAENFVDRNLKHIVNRRMKWSETAPFVNAACVELLFNIAGRRSNSLMASSMAMFELFDLVRVASNRRWSWKDARQVLVNNTRDLIQAAVRML